MSPWRVIKFIIETFFASSYVVQRGWGCRGCVIGFLWFMGVAYLLMCLFPAPSVGNPVPPDLAFVIAIIFIVVAVIFGRVLRQKTISNKGFTGRSKPE